MNWGLPSVRKSWSALLEEFVLVVDFRTSARFPTEGRGPCSPTRRPMRYENFHSQKLRTTWPQACADNPKRDWIWRQNIKEIWEKIFTFLLSVIFNQMDTFPSLEIEKKTTTTTKWNKQTTTTMIKLHFNRTRNEDNFILATAFCDRSITRQTKWSPY